MKAFLKLLVLFPIVVVVVALAMANRQQVKVFIDPFTLSAPAVGFTAPLFIVLFAALMLGIVVGGVASSLSHGKLRREVQSYRAEAERLRGELRRMPGAAEPRGTKSVASFSGGRA